MCPGLCFGLQRSRHLKVLTVEQLDKYLFSIPKYPGYQGDLGRLLFGCETEYLIESIQNPNEFMGKEVALVLFRYLAEKYNYRLPFDGPLDRINKDTKFGFISIKPDFAYSVLEISFPPRASVNDLKNLLQSTIDQIDEGLLKLGYRRATYSVVPHAPYKYDLLEMERHGTWLDLFPSRGHQSSEFYFPDYPAMMSSTQVHLNVLDRNFFEYLPLMYEVEWKAVSLFSKSQRFNGLEIGCARVFLLEETLGTEYLLKTIPRAIPTNINEYCNSFNALPKYFPKDPFFPAKDYSFIRPRTYGSVEFRSACAQTDVDQILAVCAFRVLQIAYALCHRSNPIRNSDFDARSSLLAVARTRISKEVTQSEYAKIVHERMNVAMTIVPADWRVFIERSMGRAA